MSLIRGEKDIIYDRFGAARLRILANDRIVSWGGKHVGVLQGVLVYNYRGQHVGWYENGIMRDLHGAAVGFGVDPTDTPRPYLPYRRYLPYRGYIGYEPRIPRLGYPRLRPFKKYSWSDTDLVALFGGQQ